MGESNHEVTDLKLEILRGEMRAGFSEIKALLAAVDERTQRISDLEDKLETLTVEHARFDTKLKIAGLILSMSSGGIGAALSQFLG